MSQHETTQDWPRELALDDRAGPAPLLSRAKVDDMVLGALDQAGFGALPERISGIDHSSYAPKPGLGARSLAAAAVLVLLSIGSASAAVMWFARAQHDQPKPAPANAAMAKPVVRPRPVEAEVERVAPPEQATAVPETRLAPKPPRAPEDFLVEGNRLRTERRWTKADEAYTRAAQNAPRSQTAYVARVAAAAVRLEHLHDPHGALSSYRSALKQTPRGALSEEIHWGIAEAYRVLGERAAERAALQRFVREFPSSPLVPQAKARLD